MESGNEPLSWKTRAVKTLAGFRFHHVHILESLAEMHTGRRLAQALVALPGLGDAVRFAEVSSSGDLRAMLSSIAAEVSNTGEIPVLHLECHGREDGLGIVLASEEFVPWKDLRKPLKEINTLCAVHVLLVLGICRGARILELVNPTERAPFWGYIGSDGLISAGAIEDAFPHFYATLFKTNDLVAAVKELWGRGLKLDALPVEHFFVQTYRAYLQNHFSTEKLSERALNIAREVKVPIARARRDLLASREPGFRKHRRHFFMFDLFPENESRFDVSFEEVNSEP
jgi:hypothetical protein